MEQPDKVCKCGRIQPLTLKLYRSQPLERADRETTVA